MDNENLKAECDRLREKIKQFQIQISNQDNYFYKLHLDNKDLLYKIESLEIEKLSLMNLIKEKDIIINNLMN